VRGGAEGKGKRESQADSKPSLEPHDPEILTRAEIKSWMLNQLSHPGAPRMVYLLFPFSAVKTNLGKKKSPWNANLRNRNWSCSHSHGILVDPELLSWNPASTKQFGTTGLENVFRSSKMVHHLTKCK